MSLGLVERQGDLLDDVKRASRDDAHVAVRHLPQRDRRHRHTRARHIRGDSAAAEYVPDPDSEAGFERIAVRTRVQQALRALPSSQRDAIVEVHLRERSYADVARDLRVPVGTVKSRVHLGMRTVRELLVAGPALPAAA